MQVGLMAPQGWKGEYDGWDPAGAWANTVELARQAEALGFESLWVFDHFHTVPEPTDEITFESFSSLAALAMVTSRVRIGHMVICTAFRNPALTAKLASTLDVISGGRFELGIGAGWYEHEWLAYGYGFPPVGERLGQLGDHLEVISRMLGPGRATFAGPFAQVDGAINEPKGVQRHIPVIVGGNGRRRTAGYAVQVRGRAQLRVPAARAAPGPHRRGPGTMRGSGPRPGHAPVLDVRPRRGDAARTGAGRCARHAARDGARPDRLLPRSLGSVAGRPGGVRRGLPGRRVRPRRAHHGRVVKVEIWSDVVCPWCYIGKRRFEAALERFEAADTVEITWRSFQLNPDYPVGSPRAARRVPRAQARRDAAPRSSSSTSGSWRSRRPRASSTTSRRTSR